MILQQLFPPERIKVAIEAEDREELFEELADLIARSAGKDFPRTAALAALEDRESKMSTGIKRGIALPHARVSGLKAPIGAIGVARSGLNYGSPDGEPVYLAFMVLSPTDAPELHLQALKSLAALLSDPSFYTKLVDCHDAKVAAQTVAEFEAILARE